MHFFIKLSFIILLALFFYTITLPQQNIYIYSLRTIEKNENNFLFMIQTEHTQYVEHKEALRLAKEKKLLEEKREREKVAKALMEKKRLLAKKKREDELAARLARIEEAKQIEKERKAALKRKRNQIVAKIDISQQRMKVYKGGKLIHKWKVSTGKKGHNTPTGIFRPTIMEKMHFSRQYDNAPMPYSVFFNSGIAVHGTKSIRRLGRRASHGCIRVRTKNAKRLYALIQKSGKDNTYIEVHN